MGAQQEAWHWRNRAGRAVSSRLPAIAQDVRHGLDLEALLGDDTARWNAAWTQETRRHLLDGVAALEQAIILHVQDRPFDALLADQPAGFAAAALARQPALLSPELLRHLRQRAALGLMARTVGKPGLPLMAGGEALAALLSQLAVAELVWQTQAGPDAGEVSLVRCDLPAEPYCDLAWTVTALIVQHVERLIGAPSVAAVRTLAAAGEAVIARHDEGQGAYALAARAARLVPPDDRAALADRALAEGRLLFFAALAADRSRIALDEVIDLLLDGGNRDRLALLRLSGAADASVVALFGQLGTLRSPSGPHADIALMTELYRDFADEDAQGWLARRAGPPSLALRLALLDRTAP